MELRIHTNPHTQLETEGNMSGIQISIDLDLNTINILSQGTETYFESSSAIQTFNTMGVPRMLPILDTNSFTFKLAIEVSKKALKLFFT